MRRPKLLGIGGAHIDRRGLMTADYIRGASIPGKMMEDTGGGMFNALRVAVQFGVSASMISVRGGDAAGDIVAAEIRRAGIEDLSSAFLTGQQQAIRHCLTVTAMWLQHLRTWKFMKWLCPRQISRRKTRDAIADADALLIRTQTCRKN